ncbi:MAG: DNA-directed RNA polymerase subunit omega [Candidatus Omnitrophota bacterium]|nr:MAG: DNA-directed RNA polymerase subunit omega [Candidatus Omnitrophota bacterium]
MTDIALEKLLENSKGSVYKLVVLASKRALEIAEGQPRLIEGSASVKPSILALQEMAEGKVKYKKNAPAK